MDLAREIEDTQRRQSDTLQHIVKRLRALELMPSAGADAAQGSDGSAVGHDEPWDAASAEALMQTYETQQAAGGAPTAYRASGAYQGASHQEPSSQQETSQQETSQQDWLGQPFHDVTQRIKRTLSDLKPGTTIALLEERLDHFQHHINLALEDVVRRADLEGLRRIEEHVSDLGHQLQHLERHVQRLDGIEADVRQVMDQVSDERLAKLLDYNARFAADLDAVAMRAAEEVHARLGQENHEAHARRHQELTALIEASLQDRRHTNTEASALVQDLNGHVTAQADRYNEIKALLEDTRREQRQSEQTALGMLDTLQQALVRVLDRMDTFEQQHLPPQPAPAFAEEPQPAASFHNPQTQIAEIERHFSAQRAAPEMPADTRFADYSPAHAMDEIAPAEVPASYVSAAGDTQHPDEDNHSTIERLRRDFVADARRAKMKAAANRAEAMSERSQPAWQFEDEKPAPSGVGRHAILGGASRLFGSSPKLIAGVLALVVAINGGLLLLTRKDSSVPAVPEISVPGAIEHGADAPPSDSTGTGQRSALDDLDTDFAGYGRQQQDTGLSGDHRVTPYGGLDDVLNPPQLDPTGDTASAPPGTTIVSSAVTQHEEAVAGVYEQQVLAGLSGQLGTIASKQTPGAMLPEKTGRIIDPVSPVAAHGTIPAPSAGVSRSHDGALDLPPATVGPLSLRLAAANGDASAQFEVGARLAEGKGTSQNFVEAARWYQLSAAKGFAQSQYRLGTLYERGLGVKKDLARARVWYGRAAEQGNVKAMHNLAVIVAGDQNAPDYKTAMHWFSEAAEHGLADSQFNLGVLYENGLGVAADRVAAYTWYALAAMGGDADAGGLRDALKAKMSAGELKKAEQQVNTFKPRMPARLANDALAAGEDWKRRAESGT
ncbi:hypothetical protein W911_00120 [Hyphomicrobium nitrativorans NL23]|uniref:Uncharacterized protein n=1 Tax=Hyphomicrobium nitrativorans NL23 TaxID=1029756 RepID=V5SIA7_9HYPH|nr:tetratricopeptide repeat protein [Hyphomicrobium nitrativorans]AHB49780.1 hypothetical protein W911_00120 [Hyphomicrobium nitrativorans NL23]